MRALKNAKNIDYKLNLIYVKVKGFIVLAEYLGISKSLSAAGCTGRRPVKAHVTLAFPQNFKDIISCRTHWMSAC